MTEPIKPKNEINLGGVKFDTNYAQNYGEYKIPHQNAGEFFIDFKNGTKVQYSQQPTDFTAGIFGAKPARISHYEGDEGPVYFGNVYNLQITDNSEGKLFSLNNCDNVSIDANGDRYNLVSLANCNDVTIKTNNEGADIWGFGNTNVNIETGSVHDCVHLAGSNNVNINTKGGNDYISLWDTDNFNVNSGEGNDKVEVDTGSEEIYDSREVQLPNGKVVMSEGDELTITKTGDLRFDSGRVEAGYVQTIQEMESTATVKGEGTHNVAQTPAEAFETTLRTEIRIKNFDGVETLHTEHEEKLEY